MGEILNDKYSILVKKDSLMFDCLTKYIPTFEKNKHYCYGGIRTNSKENDEGIINKEYEIILKAPYGKYSIEYNENEIDIDYKAYETIVGTNSSAVVLETITISADEKKY